MRCIECGGDTKVTNARPRQSNRFYRRRECLECGRRFTTYEEEVTVKLVSEELAEVFEKHMPAFKDFIDKCKEIEIEWEKYKGGNDNE